MAGDGGHQTSGLSAQQPACKYPGRGFNLLGEEEYSRLYRSSLFGQSYLYPTRMYKAQAAPVLASVEESARNAASGSVSDVVFEEELISMDQAALPTDATFGEGTAQTAGTALRNTSRKQPFSILICVPIRWER
mgnify:CR=1 FL=1